MKPSIIVYGPRCCGKTTNGEMLRKHFGLIKIVDEGMNPAWVEQIVPYGVLTLCEKPPRKGKRGGAILMKFEDAMRLAGAIK